LEALKNVETFESIKDFLRSSRVQAAMEELQLSRVLDERQESHRACIPFKEEEYQFSAGTNRVPCH